MGYIRFRLNKVTDSEGRTVTAFVSRMESDMPARMSSEYIFHELARKNMAGISFIFKLDEGLLNRDLLGESGLFVLDSSQLNVDMLDKSDQFVLDSGLLSIDLLGGTDPLVLDSGLLSLNYIR